MSVPTNEAKQLEGQEVSWNWGGYVFTLPKAHALIEAPSF